MADIIDFKTRKKLDLPTTAYPPPAPPTQLPVIQQGMPVNTAVKFRCPYCHTAVLIPQGSPVAFLCFMGAHSRMDGTPLATQT
jgi:hypothetical protein